MFCNRRTRSLYDKSAPTLYIYLMDDGNLEMTVQHGEYTRIKHHPERQWGTKRNKRRGRGGLTLRPAFCTARMSLGRCSSRTLDDMRVISVTFPDLFAGFTISRISTSSSGEHLQQEEPNTSIQGKSSKDSTIHSGQNIQRKLQY